MITSGFFVIYLYIFDHLLENLLIDHLGQVARIGQ